LRYIYATSHRDVDNLAECTNIPLGLPTLGPRVQGSAEDQTLEVEYRPEVIVRSDDCIGLAHRERPENHVAKR